MKHSLKNAKYRICFQTKNKVWIYKNSRLRNFYKIRSKMVLKTGRRARKFLITKNMKWTVARRQMVPYFRKTRKSVYSYKRLFFTKQQLKNFYGRLKEYQMRNFFKQTWNKANFFRSNIFIGSLEQRVSVVLYRMRLLPTIFACNQLVQHKGILVNNQLISYLYYRVNLGDIVSIPKDYWFIFYQFLYEKLRIRFLGEGYAAYRRNVVVKKLQHYFMRYRENYFKNFNLINYQSLQLKKYLFFNNFFKTFFIQLNKSHIEQKNIFWFKLIYWLFQNNIEKLLKNVSFNLKNLRLWGRQNNYYTHSRIIWYSLNLINLNFKKINLLIQEFFFNKVNLTKNLDYLNFKKETLINNFLKKKHTIQRYSIFFYKAVWRKRKSFFPQVKSRYLLWLLRNLKYKKSRKNFFKQFRKNLLWYTPKYLEIDYNTLRTTFVYYPKINEIFFAFPCSFKKIISFYKERAL
jgi:ribosomal protein S4